MSKWLKRHDFTTVIQLEVHGTVEIDIDGSRSFEPAELQAWCLGDSSVLRGSVNELSIKMFSNIEKQALAEYDKQQAAEAEQQAVDRAGDAYEASRA